MSLLSDSNMAYYSCQQLKNIGGFSILSGGGLIHSKAKVTKDKYDLSLISSEGKKKNCKCNENNHFAEGG